MPEPEWFLRERAESLAFVALTGHPDIVVDQSPNDRGIDLLVRFKDAASVAWWFGVEAIGTLDMNKHVESGHQLRKTTMTKLRPLSAYAFPGPTDDLRHENK